MGSCYRSSLRKPQSPRSAAAEHVDPIAASGGSGSMTGAARNQSAAVSDPASRRSADSVKSRSLKRESSFVRQKSNLALLTTGRDRAAPPTAAANAPAMTRQPTTTTTPVHRQSEAAKKAAVIHSGPTVSPPPLTGSPRKVAPPPAADRKAVAMTAGNMSRMLSVVSERTTNAAAVSHSPLVLSSGTFNRRLTATLSPEECKMMFTHTEKVGQCFFPSIVCMLLTRFSAQFVFWFVFPL